MQIFLDAFTLTIASSERVDILLLECTCISKHVNAEKGRVPVLGFKNQPRKKTSPWWWNLALISINLIVILINNTTSNIVDNL